MEDMRTTILLLFLCVVICPATTLTDPFHQSQSSCSFSGSPLCDVIGNEANYDIQQVTVTATGNSVGSMVTVDLYFDSGTGSGGTLGSFSDAGLSLMVGDLFFYSGSQVVTDPSDPNPTFAVPLESHNGLTAGNLYAVGSGQIETAQTALGILNPGNSAVTSDNYRNTQIVLATGGTLTTISGGGANDGKGVKVTGDGSSVLGANTANPGVTAFEYDVQVQFQMTSAFLTLESAGQFGIMFSSADCANDVIEGLVSVSSVPEPQSLALIGGGLGMRIGVGAWRRRTTRKSQAA